MRNAMFLAVTLYLALACAPTQRYVWYNPDVSKEQAARDFDDCRSRAEMLETTQMAGTPYMGRGGMGGVIGSGAAVGRFPGMTVSQEISQCMTARGYRRTPDTTEPPAPAKTE